MFAAEFDSRLSVQYELVSPATSIRSVHEGFFMLQHGQSPYLGDHFHQPPLLLLVFLPLINRPILLRAFFIAMDIAIALALRKLCWWHLCFEEHTFAELRLMGGGFFKTKQSPMFTPFNLPDTVALIYLLHPASVLTCVAMSTACVCNLAIVLALYCSHKGDMLRATLALAIAAYLSLFPLALLPVIILLIVRAKAAAEITDMKLEEDKKHSGSDSGGGQENDSKEKTKEVPKQTKLQSLLRCCRRNADAPELDPSPAEVAAATAKEAAESAMVAAQWAEDAVEAFEDIREMQKGAADGARDSAIKGASSGGGSKLFQLDSVPLSVCHTAGEMLLKPPLLSSSPSSGRHRSAAAFTISLFLGWALLLLVTSAFVLDQPLSSCFARHVGREEGIIGGSSNGGGGSGGGGSGNQWSQRIYELAQRLYVIRDEASAIESSATRSASTAAALAGGGQGTVNKLGLASEDGFVREVYGWLLSAPDHTPNIGLFWYFFIEVGLEVLLCVIIEVGLAYICIW
jgi:hypothetical protein